MVQCLMAMEVGGKNRLLIYRAMPYITYPEAVNTYNKHSGLIKVDLLCYADLIYCNDSFSCI